MFPVDLVKSLGTAFLYLWWLLLAVLTHYSKVRWGACFLILSLHVLSILIKNLKKNNAQIIIYYHVTKQFLPCLNWLTMCFQFQNMFWTNISCLWFWWKTYSKLCANIYAISCIKRLSLPALCIWSSAFNFRKWFGKPKCAM